MPDGYCALRAKSDILLEWSKYKMLDNRLIWRTCCLLFGILYSTCAVCATLAETISNELVLASELAVKLKIDKDCPVTEADASVSVRRKLFELNIPVSTSNVPMYSMTIRTDCITLPDNTIIYAGDLELHVPVMLPSSLMEKDPDAREVKALPIWSAKRFGSLGQPPGALQARALFTEIDSMVTELNEMWVRSRAYPKSIAQPR
jgi:hypothetical protein